MKLVEGLFWWDGLQPISLLIGVILRAYQGTTGSRPERVTSRSGLRFGPDSYGEAAVGMAHNGGKKPDAATPREMEAFGCKPLAHGQSRNCGLW